MYEQEAPPSSSAWFGPTLDTGQLLGQTMELVAITTGVFALGAYLGRDLSYGWGLVFFLGAFGCLFAMRATVKTANTGAAIGLLFLFGLLIGFGTGPTIAYYASENPTAVWQAGAATALFMAGIGAYGYSTKRDLSFIGRLSLWALVGFIILSIIGIFLRIPTDDLVWSILGLVIFAGLTMFDFQRLRRTTDTNAAPFLAASIFLDALNVFLFFLRIFGRN